MTIDRNITSHPTPYPDKDTQDPSSFNSAVDDHLQWLADELVPDINEWANQANTTQNDISTKHSDIDTWHTETETYRDELLDSQIFQATSSTSVDLSSTSSGDSVTLTLAEDNRGYSAGSRIRIVDSADPTVNYFEGVVSDYDDSSDDLVIEVANVTGTDTISSWVVNLNHGGDADTVDGSHASAFALRSVKTVSSACTAANGEFIHADTSGGAFTISCPSSPSDGNTVGIRDKASNFGTNNLTLDGNGLNILGASTFVFDVTDQPADFEFNSDRNEWIFARR